MNRAYEGHASRSKATSSLKRRIGWLNLLLFFWLRGENEIVSTSYEIMMMRHVIKMGNGSPNMSFDAMLLYSNIEAEKNCFTRLNDAFLHSTYHTYTTYIMWRVKELRMKKLGLSVIFKLYTYFFQKLNCKWKCCLNKYIWLKNKNHWGTMEQKLFVYLHI